MALLLPEALPSDALNLLHLHLLYDTQLLPAHRPRLDLSDLRL